MPAFEVLFVCVGNICRSPFAERLLRLRLAQAGAAPGDFRVSSAGTMSVPGALMSVPMRLRLQALGGSAEGFASRQLEPPLVSSAGLVLTATRDIRSHVLEESPAALRRTFTILEAADLAVDAVRGQSLSVAIRDCDARRSTGRRERADLVDPIRQPPVVQDRVAGQLDTAITAITAMLLANPHTEPGRRAAGTRAGS